MDDSTSFSRAPSDGVTNYTDADALADCGVWGARVEQFPTPTSYLATTTVSAARNGDDIRFDGAGHYLGSPTTMDAQVLCPVFDNDAQRAFFTIGISGTDFAFLDHLATDFPSADATVTTAQWAIAGVSGDVTDGIAHKLRQTMATNAIEAFYDGVSFGTDTLATLPTAATATLRIGAGITAGQPSCLIARARIWPSLVTPAVTP